MKRKTERISKIPKNNKLQNKISKPDEASPHISGCPSNWLKEKTRYDCLKLKQDIFWSMY